MRYFILFKLLLINQLTIACADYGYDLQSFIILNPDVFGPKSARSLFYTSYSRFLVEPKSYLDEDELNLSLEWKKELKLKSDVYAIRNYFFAGLKEEALKKNEFYLEQKGNKKLFEFINFAKRCESVVNFKSYWDEKAFIEKYQLLPEYLEEGLNYLKTEKQNFWKKKYAFQVLRLAYYSKNKALFYRIFNTYFKKQKSRTVLDWWSLHYYSMVLEDKNESDSANYIHAQVWANCTNKMSVSRNWYSGKRLAHQLKLAQSEEERTALYLIDYATKFSTSIPDLERLSKLASGHPRFEFLLAREMNKLEEKLGATIFLAQPVGYYSYNYDDGEVRIEKSKINFEIEQYYLLLSRLRNRENKIEHLDVLLAETAMLLNKYSLARNLIEHIEVKDKKMMVQKMLLSLTLEVLSGCLKDEALQEKIGVELKQLIQLRKGVFYGDQQLNSFFRILETKAKQDGMEALATNAYYFYTNEFPNNYWWQNPDYIIQNYLMDNNYVKGASDWISQFRKAKKNTLEDLFFGRFQNDFAVRDCLARLYFRNAKWKAAMDMSRTIPDYYPLNSRLIVNPFTRELPNKRTKESVHYYTHSETFARVYALQMKKKTYQS